MKIKEYNPNGLGEYDRKLYKQAMEFVNDCNRWQYVGWLGTIVQNPKLKSILHDTSKQMLHQLEYYQNLGIV